MAAGRESPPFKLKGLKSIYLTLQLQPAQCVPACLCALAILYILFRLGESVACLCCVCVCVCVCVVPCVSVSLCYVFVCVWPDCMCNVAMHPCVCVWACKGTHCLQWQWRNDLQRLRSGQTRTRTSERERESCLWSAGRQKRLQIHMPIGCMLASWESTHTHTHTHLRVHTPNAQSHTQEFYVVQRSWRA